MKKLVPKHPRTDEFVAQGLYSVSSFKELEAKISALGSKDELWRQASTNGESPSVPSVSETPENVIKFFEPEDAVPPWRWESNEDCSERESLTDLGG